jgi:hypothetical protein
VNLYTDFINSAKAANRNFNVSEVWITERRGGQKRSAERLVEDEPGYDVDNRFYDRTEYNTMYDGQQNILQLKRVKRGHVGRGGSSNNHNGGESKKSNIVIKYMNRTVAALGTTIDNLTLVHDGDISDEEDSDSDSSDD